MSYTSEVRRELSHVPCDRRCCALSELTALALCSGALSFRGQGRYGLCFHLDSAEVSERCMAMCKKFLGTACGLRVEQISRLGGVTRYAVAPPDESTPDMLAALHLLDENQPFGMRLAPDQAFLSGDCCRRAFLRGAYLACGSLSDPKKSYHLEWAVADEPLSDALGELLTGFDLPARRSARRGKQVVYLKDAEHIATLLALLGAHRAMLELEDVRILKSMRNEANRMVNCDSSNVDKTLAAAEKQLSVIQTIEKHIGLDALPEPLRDIAELRARYPDASLSDLGGMATPSIGKSGVNARMRKLEAIAEELLNG